MTIANAEIAEINRSLAAELERLRRQNGVLVWRVRDLADQVNALRPFAGEATFWDGASSNGLRPALRAGAYEDACGVDVAAFTVGDLRRARDLVGQARSADAMDFLAGAPDPEESGRDGATPQKEEGGSR